MGLFLLFIQGDVGTRNHACPSNSRNWEPLDELMPALLRNNFCCRVVIPVVWFWLPLFLGLQTKYGGAVCCSSPSMVLCAYVLWVEHFFALSYGPFSSSL